MEQSYVIPRIIFETVVGSRSYGIHNPDSDYDRSGVMIPGLEYFFGFDKFEQFMGFPEKDRVIYDIRKALKLILDNNPNMLDLLCMPDKSIITITPYWERFREKSELFISKKCRYTFSGYSLAQLKRIKTHRKFLLDPPDHAPTRKEFDLPDHSTFPTSQLKAIFYSVIEIIIEEEKTNFLDELDSIYRNYISPLMARFISDDNRMLAMEWLQLSIKSQANTFRSLGPKYIKDEYLEAADKEVKFYIAHQEWKRYKEWAKNRNKDRAEMEKKFGYDCKHAAHLVRLMRMGEEILRTGKVNVDRTNIDAEELKAIRNGAWKYDDVESYSDEMDKKMGELYLSSTLQKSPKSDEVRSMCIEVVKDFQTMEYGRLG